ncbi:hypothetical protein D3C78_1466610 [compost metagenome]
MDKTDELRDDDEGKGDQAALEDLPAGGVVAESAAGQHGVAVEITLAAHLRPGGINADGDDRQENIDDPDSKIFLGISAERAAFDCALIHADRDVTHNGPSWHAPLRAD